MTKKMNFGKFGRTMLRYAVAGIIGSFFFFLLTFFTTILLVNIPGAVGIWIVSAIVVALLMWIYNFRPGIESPLVDLLPIFIISSAVVATLNGIGVTVISATVTTATELGIAIFSLYLADTLLLKNIKFFQK